MYSCHQTCSGHDEPLGCWTLVPLCEDAARSMLGRHLIHLSLREPPESAPNKQLGESGDGRGWKGCVEGKGVKGGPGKDGRRMEVKSK